MDAPASLTLEPIGFLRTALQEKVEAPRQPAAASGIPGVIELLPGRNLEHAIEDLQGWQRIWVIFWFDRNKGWRPKVLPPRSTTGRKGVLATRSPHRPNPLGLSVLRLDKVDGLNLHVRDVDLLDGTPVFDIKPYVPYTDAFPEAESGWLEVADPKPDWTVQFEPAAQAQLAWIEARASLPLRARIESTLQLGPQPHPYRRIRRARDGAMMLAVQDWRARFSVDGSNVTVENIQTGYRESQLQGSGAAGSAALELHRAYREQFA